MIISPLSSKQALSWQLAEARLCCWEGSVRSGKTIASLLAWAEYVRQAPPGNLAMIGRTERTLKRNIVDVLVEMFGRKRARHVQESGELWFFGRRVYLYGANNEEARTKIQGTTLLGAYVDEATTIPESFVTMLLSRLSLPGARCFMTMNPDSPMHWLKTGYLDRARLHLDSAGRVHGRPEDEDGPDLARFSFRLSDNETLPAEYIAALEQEYTGLWYKRFILGEWVVAAGAVYEEWDPTRHVTATPPGVNRLLAVGIDYGDTAPTRGYLVGVSIEERPRLVVVDEWAPAKGLTQAALSASLRKWLAGRMPEWIAVDPAAAGFRNQLFTDGMANTMPAKNAVVGGIRVVASLLATDRLVVSDKCIELLKEFPSYVWDPKATAKGKDEPLKQNDHSVDALRYAIASTQQLWGSVVPLTVPVDLEEAA